MFLLAVEYDQKFAICICTHIQQTHLGLTSQSITRYTIHYNKHLAFKWLDKTYMHARAQSYYNTSLLSLVHKYWCDYSKKNKGWQKFHNLYTNGFTFKSTKERHQHPEKKVVFFFKAMSVVHSLSSNERGAVSIIKFWTQGSHTTNKAHTWQNKPFFFCWLFSTHRLLQLCW